MTAQDLQAERALLGAAMMSQEARDLAADRLTAESFYDPRHQHLFHVLLTLAADAAPSDPITVADALAKQQLLETVGGHDFLVELAEAAPTRDRSSVQRWVGIIEEAHSLRLLAAAAHDISELASTGGDASDALETAERLLGTINRPTAGAVVSSADLIAEQWDRLERLRAGDVDEGLPTGLPALDEVLGGLVDDRLYVIAARPSMGKTSLAYNFVASGAMDHHKPVLLVSLEMRGNEVIQRITASKGMIRAEHFDTGQFTPEESVRLEQVSSSLAGAPIYLLDTSDTTVQSIRAAARKIKSMHGGELGLIVIDYIQLMSGSGGRGRNDSRQQEVSDISRGCKVMARDLNVPVVALSQLSRQVEQRQDKRPMLSDLRESGAIEQDADAVVFIYRDEFYNPATDEPGVAELLVAKNRQGAAGVTVKVRWVPEWVSFMPADASVPASNSSTRPAASAGIPNEF